MIDNRWFQVGFLYLPSLWLMAGAAFKSFSYIHDPQPHLFPFSNPWAIALVIGLELLLALLLVMHVYVYWIRALCACVFIAFSTIHAYLSIFSSEQCGCFGSLSVPSWITIPTSLLLALLLICHKPPIKHWEKKREFFLFCGSVMLSIFIAGGLIVARSYLINPLTPSYRVNAFLSDLLPRIPHSTAGSLTIVLYRNGCPHCIEKMPQFIARAEVSDPQKQTWCFVNIGHDDDDADITSGLPADILRIKSFTDDITTPMVIDIANGNVTRIDSDM